MNSGLNSKTAFHTSALSSIAFSVFPVCRLVWLTMCCRYAQPHTTPVTRQPQRLS